MSEASAGLADIYKMMQSTRDLEGVLRRLLYAPTCLL